MKEITYGRKLIKGRNADYKKRLILSWLICFGAGLLIGCLLVILLTPKHTTGTYGTIDGKVFTEEPSLEWSTSVERGFIPLDVPMDEEMQKFIYCLSHGYNIDFSFVMALISHESNFTSNASSDTGDHGLMQINEINHEWLSKELGVTDFNDPCQNARCGMFILRKLFEKYEDPTKVLMAYNMGETGASRLWEQGVFETNYSRTIMSKAAEFTQQILEKKGEQ